MKNILLMGAPVLYAISRMAVDFVLMLRFMNPRDRLADVHILWMWLVKESLSLISTLRYLEPPHAPNSVHMASISDLMEYFLLIDLRKHSFLLSLLTTTFDWVLIFGS